MQNKRFLHDRCKFYFLEIGDIAFPREISMQIVGYIDDDQGTFR